jgi:diguanylate cyclase (GGDEF)-like protein
MSLEPLDALSRLAERRFGSFADAATAVLDLLASAVPGGCVLLGQVDWEASEFRVLDSRGPAVTRGMQLPLAGEPDSNELIDPRALAHVRPVPWASAALDAADGSVVGVLLAAAHGDSPSPDQLRRLLLIAARLLSYEWESVSTRAELRRLADSARDRLNTDPVTGLLARAALVEASEREWELSRRGTVETHVVVCHLRDRPDVVDRHGAALADLILRDVAEVLAGGVRRTDHLGRVADDCLAAVLVGCKGPDGALAFLHRVEQALARVAAARPEVAALSYGTRSLADAESARQALDLAEAAARAGQHVAPLGDPATVEAA